MFDVESIIVETLETLLIILLYGRGRGGFSESIFFPHHHSGFLRVNEKR